MVTDVIGVCKVIQNSQKTGRRRPEADSNMLQQHFLGKRSRINNQELSEKTKTVFQEAGFFLLKPLSLACMWLPPCCLYMVFLLRIPAVSSSSKKDINHFGLRSHPYNFIYPLLALKRPCFQLQLLWGLEFPHMNLWGA